LESKREIIYVDAGSTNSDNFRICLYPMNNDDIHIMEVEKLQQEVEKLRLKVKNQVTQINALKKK